MRVLRRDAQLVHYFVWLTRCWALSCMLSACTIGAAWGQDTAGAMTQTQHTSIAVPKGLVRRVGDGSVILHWDPVVASRLAGYRVYRTSSPTEPLEPYSVILPTNH